MLSIISILLIIIYRIQPQTLLSQILPNPYTLRQIVQTGCNVGKVIVQKCIYFIRSFWLENQHRYL